MYTFASIVHGLATNPVGTVAIWAAMAFGVLLLGLVRAQR